MRMPVDVTDTEVQNSGAQISGKKKKKINPFSRHRTFPCGTSDAIVHGATYSTQFVAKV